MSLTLHDVIHIFGKQFHSLVRIQMKAHLSIHKLNTQKTEKLASGHSVLAKLEECY